MPAMAVLLISWAKIDQVPLKLTQRGSTFPSAGATAFSLPPIHHPLNDGRRKTCNQAATIVGKAIIFLPHSMVVGIGKIPSPMCSIRSLSQYMSLSGHACIRQCHQFSHHNLYKRSTLLMPALIPNHLDHWQSSEEPSADSRS